MATLSIDVKFSSEVLSARLQLGSQGESCSGRAEFTVEWTDQDQEDLRWYLEDYLIYPTDLARNIANRIERRLTSTGVALFHHLFSTSQEVKTLWSKAKHLLPQTRIEIRSADSRAAILPWELVRDPDSDDALALSCSSFVRIHSAPARSVGSVQSSQESPVRILLVICRPAAANDVPFRSVASKLFDGLGSRTEQQFRIDVLRPPTFGQLSRVLRRAALLQQPYHAIHFDGHGIERGVLFENPSNADNSELIAGSRLGSLLAASKVPVLILNACRSAFADPPTEPVNTDTTHQSIRVFGSVAHIAADQGIACVIAMRFNVFVETASRFMLDFYSALGSGISAGEAVNFARAQLNADPIRETIPAATPLQDWLVPLIFESEPVRLASPNPPAASDEPVSHATDEDLPRRPEIGFFGRDEALLAIDRAFDSDNIVLVHAYAGSGKTATAAEFGRWYLRTGGTERVLFTTFETYRNLAQLLDQVGQRFRSNFERKNIEWAAILEGASRRQLALNILSEAKPLWIWDNVEPIGGFPAGNESLWTASEQRELADFLSDASARGVKFLLTSRRDETAWLGLLPKRVIMAAMPVRERVQLAQGLAAKMGRRLGDLADWRPLLDFSQGNPLTITVVVSQALRDRLRGAEIRRFVAELRDGTAEIQDETEQGRSRSLAASLRYGLHHSFSHREKKVLALLHLFQGGVNVDVFALMGNQLGTSLSEIADLSYEELKRSLTRASEIGILEPVHRNIYRIHPAVPWFFRDEFQKYFSGREAACRTAFCNSVGLAAARFSDQFNQAQTGAAEALRFEEANIRYALKLSIEMQLWTSVMALLHGLEDLYLMEGNLTQWRELVSQVSALVTDPASGAAIEGRELPWRAVTEYQMRIARSTRSYAEMIRLARILVDDFRTAAEPYLSGRMPASEGFQEIHNLSVMLDYLGTALRDQRLSEGVPHLEEAYRLAVDIGDRRQAALAAQNLTRTFEQIESIRDFKKAAYWLYRALDVVDSNDFAIRGKLNLLSGAFFVREFEAANEARDDKAYRDSFETAATAYLTALKLLPDYAQEDRAEAHVNFGALLLQVAGLTEAEKYLREGLQLAQACGSTRFTVNGLYNLASLFYEQNRLADAKEFAKAAISASTGLIPDEALDASIRGLELLAKIQGEESAASKEPAEH